MKKNNRIVLTGLILATSLLFIPILYAQEIRPSQAATLGSGSGSNGLSVDHATGTFTYSIPLAYLGNEQQAIPLGISYYSGGIKMEQTSEIVGYGWALDGPMAVSRTVRGMPDEDISAGILENPLTDTTSDEHIRKINSNDKDGENDIFSARLKNKTVKFFITYQDGGIVAIPLEKTNVKIECNYLQFGQSKGGSISGFQITDDDGTRYTYLEGEKKGQQITGGDIKVNAFYAFVTTAWYIAGITLPNDETIKFEYNDAIEEVDPSIWNTYWIYGTPMKKIMGGNSEIRNKILENERTIGAIEKQIMQDRYMYEAQYNSYSVDMKMIDGFAGIYGDISNSNKFNSKKREEEIGKFNVENQGLIFHAKVVAWELERINASYNQQLDFLNNEIRSLIEKNISLQQELLTTLTDVYEESVGGRGNSVTYPKTLKCITQKDIVFNFTYDTKLIFTYEFRNQQMLVQIEKRTLLGRVLESINFGYSGHEMSIAAGLLTQMTRNDKNGILIDKFSFNYYVDSISKIDYEGRDYWGYCNGAPNVGLLSEELFNSNQHIPDGHGLFFNSENQHIYNLSTKMLNLGKRAINKNFTTFRSLKTIYLPYKGNISFEYENNDIANEAAQKNVMVGGLRIKKITTSDSVGNRYYRTFKYNFPSGKSAQFTNKSTGVYTRLKKKTFHYVYDYDYGSDVAYYSHPVDIGAAFTPALNNEFFYTYVEESDSKGSYGYKYFNYAGSDDDIIDNEKNNYWLDHLLLAKYTFNKNYELIAVQRNKYFLSDEDATCEPVHRYPKWLSTEYQFYKDKNKFFVNSNTRKFNKFIYQLKPPHIYYDEKKFCEAYPDKMVYINGSTGDISWKLGINPRHLYFYPNIAPRISDRYQVSKNYYSLYYGGAILPQSIESISFEKPVAITGNIAINALLDYMYALDDIADNPQHSAVKQYQTFQYNNPAHTNPTLTTTTDSKNDTVCTVSRYVLDFALPATDPVTKLWTDQNINALIEQTSYRKKAGGNQNYMLLQGNLFEYNVCNSVHNKRILLDKVYEIKSNNAGYALPPGVVTDNNKHMLTNPALYTYTALKQYDWREYPWGIAINNERDIRSGQALSTVYDLFAGKPLLITKGINSCINGFSIKTILPTTSTITPLAMFMVTPFTKMNNQSKRLDEKFIECTDSEIFFLTNHFELATDFNRFVDDCTNNYQLWNTIEEIPFFTFLYEFFYMLENYYSDDELQAQINSYQLLNQEQDILSSIESLWGTYPNEAHLLTTASYYLHTMVSVSEEINYYSSAGFNEVKPFSLNKPYRVKLNENDAFEFEVKSENLSKVPKLRVLTYNSYLCDVTYKVQFNDSSYSNPILINGSGCLQSGKYEEIDLSSFNSIKPVVKVVVYIPKYYLWEISDLYIYPAENQIEIYDRDTENKLTSSFDSRLMKTSYTYYDDGKLESIKDNDGNVVKKIEYNIAEQPGGGESAYFNTGRSQGFYRNNCNPGSVGGSVTYTVAANKYSSVISQADADAKAQSDINTNGQIYANNTGTCGSFVYKSVSCGQYFVKSDCPPPSNGTGIFYDIPEGKYTSVISQADADAKAWADIYANGQAYTNTNGGCNNNIIYARLVIVNEYTDWLTGDVTGDLYIVFMSRPTDTWAGEWVSNVQVCVNRDLYEIDPYGGPPIYLYSYPGCYIEMECTGAEILLQSGIGLVYSNMINEYSLYIDPTGQGANIQVINPPIP